MMRVKREAIFGVVLGVLIVWFISFDFPSGASREVGVYLALAGAAAVATGAGDFRVTSWFPRLPHSDLPGDLEREREQVRPSA